MSDDIFITDDFLLDTPQARRLYHDYAEGMPIIDYHCHLPPQQVAEDTRFENMTRIWLNGDHYKWRAMRACGVDEKYCTGGASDWEKFAKWAEVVPMLLRNPLYHWTHLELKRPFGIADRLLNPQAAKGIWDECNEKLAQPGFSARGIMKRMNVALVCTTDDPTDTLEHHKTVAEDESFNIPVLPTWRPDKGMAVENPEAFNVWVEKLAAVSDTDIGSLDDFLTALSKRHDYFAAMGCRLSDHGLETACAADYTQAEVAAVFDKVRAGNRPDAGETLKFKSAMIYEFAVMDHEKDWTQQFHFGPMRNVNTRMFEALGPDTGFDTIGDFQIGRALARMLDRLDREGKLPKTILYNLNPRDNELLAAMLGNFPESGVPGKMQFGSAWWFCDTMDGMKRQIEALSSVGVLRLFVGMLTDSRSFLSYARHEYFRRILCNILGGEMAAGVLPNDMDLVGATVRDISYNNAARYFGFDLS